MAPALTQVTQNVQSAVTALDGALPQLTAQGRIVLQELFAALVSGGQSIGASLPVDAAVSASIDVGIDSGLSSLDQSFAPDSNSSTLDTLRHEFKRELRSSMSHVAEIPPEHRERIGRREASSDILSSLSIPARAQAFEQEATQRKPFLKL